MTTNTDHVLHRREQQRPAKPKNDRIDAATAETAETAERTATPEAVQATKVARRAGSEKSTTFHDARRARGVDWVRPTDLMARQSATVAGRGIDFEVELARRTRQLSGHVALASGRRAFTAGKVMSERARRLPDVSEFGRGSRSQSWVTRSGIGLG